MMAGADLVYNHAAFREAREHYVMMLEAAERTGSIINQAEALVRTTLVQLAMGDFEDAGGPMAKPERSSPASAPTTAFRRACGGWKRSPPKRVAATGPRSPTTGPDT